MSLSKFTYIYGVFWQSQIFLMVYSKSHVPKVSLSKFYLSFMGIFTLQSEKLAIIGLQTSGFSIIGFLQSNQLPLSLKLYFFSFRLISKLNPFPGMKHLDVAGGTGNTHPLPSLFSYAP